MRLRIDGFDVHTQVPVTVSHGSFEKTFYLDLVVDHMLYELKVVSQLLAEHQAQVLHYAMLNDVRRAKLLNFRSARVHGWLQYNPMTEALRHQPKWITHEWKALTPGCERLFAHVTDIVQNWGTHLDSRLYHEAVIHHFGGEPECLRRVPVMQQGKLLGTHLIHQHAQDHCFVVTAIHRRADDHRRHLQCQVENLEVRAMQWINFNHSDIEFTTLFDRS